MSLFDNQLADFHESPQMKFANWPQEISEFPLCCPSPCKTITVSVMLVNRDDLTRYFTFSEVSKVLIELLT